ncbi:PaaI family thioesterase [Dietzia sp. SLG310A2-38A2]|uniref:PaaI family thioesterase n=1 Tax=Dietzia sp. SLG310A2-38A2 TaxID=1630643 RepID=UPI0015F94179|nr:PaaI family thioesterase [Dietzia sp. SLG310A2-38A2]MBB1029940.1 PaaI family thioesterase [Dietzia sp. SLG310A2-38A2]
MTTSDGFPDASSDDASRFVRASGLVVDEVTATSLRGHAVLGDDHLTAWGTVHGGVYASIVESAGGAGAGAAVADRGQIAVGVHNGTDFLRASTGGRVNVIAEALFQGRSQQLWDVVISQSESGRVLARGQLRLQNVPRPDPAPHG